MPTRLGLLIFLVYMAIHVISAIAQHRKKQREQQEAMEAAHRQRELGEHGGQAQSSATPPANAPVASDVEARRQAQLEQLRRRREGRRQGAPVPPTQPVRPGLPRPGISATRPAPIAAPPLGSSEQDRLRAQEAERRDREQQRRNREQAAQAAAQSQARIEQAEHKAQVARERRESETALREAAAEAALRASRSPFGVRSGTAASTLASRLRDPATMREVIVLREVLDRPVALRSEASL